MSIQQLCDADNLAKAGRRQQTLDVRRLLVVVGSLTLAASMKLSAQSILTIAGGGTDDGRPATVAGLGPSGMAVDAAGNFYFSDSSRIRKVVAGSGIITTVAGNGAQGFSGDGGAATAAGLAGPAGVALDSAGNLYIVDAFNYRIRKVAAGSGIITTVAGNGSQGFSGDGGVATSAGFYGLSDLALDSVGNLYISDTFPDGTNGRIRKVAVGSGIITTVAGNGSPVFSGDGGPATAAGLKYPRGVALDSAGNLYIADYNQRIRKVAAGSGIITTVAGNGSFGFSGDGGTATAAALNDPNGVALDSAGNLYIADLLNNRIRKVTAESGIITTVAGNGSFGFSGDGGTATAAGLSYPVNVALDSTGNLYIADSTNHRIRKIASGSEIITTVAGNGSLGFSGDGGVATAAKLSFPQRVALDSAGNLYIVVTNNRIRKVAAGNGIITTVAGNDFDQFGNGRFGGDGGAATAAALFGPEGLALDSEGNLYIADTFNHRIRKVAVGNGIITTVAGTGFTNPDGSGGFSGDGGPATAARLNFPSSVALDLAGDLYIADGYNQRIRKVTAGNGIITTVAGSGFNFYNGDGGAATTADLNSPSGVALDLAGNLYIADQLNNRIRKVSAGSGIITTVAGNGAYGDGNGSFSGDGGSATIAGLALPRDVAVDTFGNLYIADAYNYRIRKVAAGSGIITTVAGNGSFGFSGDGGAATAAGLSASGVALDSAGNLYIADADSNRVRTVFGCVTVPRPDLTVPANGEHGVSTSARLAWSPVKGAFSYDVYLDTSDPPQSVLA